MKQELRPTLSKRFQRLAAISLSCLAAYPTLAGTEHWQGQPGVTATINWTDPANWAGLTPPQTYYNQVQFTGIGANAINDFSVNSIFDAATGVAQVPIWQLDYNNVNGNYTTLINPGVTLRIDAGNGRMYVGAGGNVVDAVETIKFTGDEGTLSAAGGIIVQQSSSQPDAHNVTLDMSELGTFLIPGRSDSRVLIASTGNHGHGTVYLAKTNTIALDRDVTIGWQGGSSNTLPCALYLGKKNSITTGNNWNYVIVGQSGGNDIRLGFNPALVNANPPAEAYFGSSASDGRGNLQVAANGGSPSAPAYGICDFSGGKVTMLEDSIQLGMAGDTAVASALGILSFDNGTIDANTVVAGNQTASSGGVGVGVLNINTNDILGASASLMVKTLTLAKVNGTLTPGTEGTVNVNGGSLAANVITNGGGVAKINVNRGILTVTNFAGVAGAPLTSLAITNSTLQISVVPGTANVVVDSLTTAGANRINVLAVPVINSFPAQVTVVKYSGSIAGAGNNFSLGTLPQFCAGYLSNNVANGSIDLVLTSGPRALTWTGASNGNWDTSTVNWLAAGATVYANGNFVSFLDGAVNSSINLTTELMPGGITVSNTGSYTYSGSGFISGNASLVKQGAGTLIIDNSGINSFTGGFTIGGGQVQIGNNDSNGNLPAGTVNNEGTLTFARNDSFTIANAIVGSGSVRQQGAGSTLTLSGANTYSGSLIVTNGSRVKAGNGSALGSTSGTTIIGNGSTLDINGEYLWWEPLTVSGAGMNGAGAIVNSGGGVYGLGCYVTLAGDTTFGGPNRWDLSGATLSSGGNAYNVTYVTPTPSYFEWKNLNVDPMLGDINLTDGVTLGIVGSTSAGDPTKTLTLNANAGLVFYNGSGDAVLNKKLVVNPGARVANGGGATIISGGVTLLNSYCSFDVGGNSLTLSGPIQGNGTLYKAGGTSPLILSGNSPAFTGDVYVEDGKLVLNGSIPAAIGTEPESTIAGNGTAGGLVDIYGALAPGDVGVAGTLTVGGLVLQGGATLTMDLNSATTTGSGVNDLLQVNGDLTVSGNTLYINPVGTSLTTGTWYTLITYTGTASGFFNSASTLLPSRYSFTLTNVTTTSPKQIRVMVSGSGGGPTSLVWNNASNDSQWNTAGSMNWSNLLTHLSPEAFYTQDSVLFNDLAASKTVQIASQMVVSPSMINVDATGNYTIEGAGKISGAARLVKQGSGSLTMKTVNDFTGNVEIRGGTVISGNNSSLGTASGTIIVTNGGTLELNGTALGSTKPVIVSGSGVGGNGAIVNNGGGVYHDSGSPAVITLAGDTTIGGSSRWDLGSSSVAAALNTGGKPYNLTVVGNTYRQWQNLKCDTNLANIELMAGELGLAGSTTLGNPTNTLTIHSGAQLTFWGGSGYAKRYNVESNGKIVVRYDSGLFDLDITLQDGATFASFDAAKTITGPISLQGLAHFASGNNLVTFSNVISGPGGFYWDMYDNKFAFAAANTYTGPTLIQGGGLTLALIGNGSISHSTNISLAANATLDVNGRTDKTLTLAAGQVLNGQGRVAGNLLVGLGATVSPGLSGIGTLYVNDAVSLQGVTSMELGSGSNDQLSSASIGFGGTLNLNFTPDTLTAGKSFKLFNATSYSGSFNNIVPATPGTGLSWDLSQLTTSGTIGVTSGVNPAPAGVTAVITGNQLDLTWPADRIGWRLQVQSNPLSVGLGNNWVDVEGSTTTNRISIQIGSNTGAVFYRMVYP